MEFSLTTEQNMLKDSLARFVTEAHGFEEARRLMREHGGFSPAHWKQFSDLGLLSLLVSADNGGMDGTLVDCALVMEEFGKGLVGAPYVSSAVLGALLIEQAPPGAERTDLLARLLAGDLVAALADEEEDSRYSGCVSRMKAIRQGQGFRLSGRKIMSLDGGVANGFIVSALMEGEGATVRPALFYVPATAAGLKRRAYRTIDGRTAADLDAQDVPLAAGALLARPEVAEQSLGRALDAARLMLAADALGIMEAAIAATVDYLQTREQFGRPLASYQVLTHRVSEMLVRKEHARSMLYRGLSRMEAADADRSAAVSATMVAIIETGEFVGSQAIQLHGGIGMTEEYAVGHYYKRLRAIGKSYGDHGWHMQRFMRLTNALEGRNAA